MRTALGPALANVLFVCAGLAVLAALRMVRRTAASVIAALGLAFCVGAASVSLLTLIAVLAGVSFTAGTVEGVSLAIIIGAGAVVLRRPRARVVRGTALPRLKPIEIVKQNRALTAFVVLFGTYAIIGLVRASVMPMNLWDGWALWTRKALLLTDFNHLPVAFFTAPAYASTHQNYPLLLPMLEATWFRFAGMVDTQAVHVELWLLLIGFVWAAAFVLARRGAPVVTWAPVLMLVAIATGTYSQLLSGSADIPMAIFAGLGILLLGLWTSSRQPEELAISALMLAAAANTKNEGMPVAVIALIVAAVVVYRTNGSAIRQLAFAAAGVAVAVLPWRIWIAVHHVPADPDVPLRNAFNLPYLFGRLQRLGPSFSALHHQLADQRIWSYVLPIGAGIALACMVWRVARRQAAFYLATGTLICLLYVWVYWFSPLDLKYYLGTSSYRVIDVIVFIGAAAALQLPAEIQARRRT